MPKSKNRRSTDLELNADLKIFEALKAISDYRPINPAYTVEALEARYAAQQAADEAERKAREAFSAAHEAAMAADRDLHDAVMGIKYQVIAQYGLDSDQVASLGLKKKSDHKAPVRKSKAAASAPENDQQ
jgi:biotin synthase-like enzyme